MSTTMIRTAAPVRPRVTTPAGPRDAARTHRWLGVVAILAIVAGQAQNILEAEVPPEGLFVYLTFLDDALVVLAFLVAVPRLSRAAGGPVLVLVLWLALLAFAAWRSISVTNLPVSETLFLFRQVAIPAVIMIVGIVLTRDEWRRIGSVVIALGLVNAVYAAIELVFGRPFEPVEAKNGAYIGYYSGTDIFTGDSVERAGGLLLNPPTMGLFFAAALAFAFYRKDLRGRWIIVVVLAAALWVTNSRGGLLAAGIALILPWAARKFSVWVAVAVMAIAAAPIAAGIASQQGSGRHSEGLVLGLTHAFENPLGRGFGYIGNHRAGDRTETAGESLMAIPFSAAGIVAVIIALLIVFAYIRHIDRGGERSWVSALALGGVAAAFLAETASAVNGTIPIWLAAGFAFSHVLRDLAKRDDYPAWLDKSPRDNRAFNRS